MMGSALSTIPEVEARLRRRYAEPGRHYHGQAHIDVCLAIFQTNHEAFSEPAAVELAIWFHDAIYDPRAKDNEEQSANLAEMSLVETGMLRQQIVKVRQLILATKHDAAPADQDARLLVDIDLSILGADQAAFDAYEQAIRREYAHVPDEAFRVGRRMVLERFLARERIYLTDRFATPFETRARSNLQRSIAGLNEP